MSFPLFQVNKLSQLPSGVWHAGGASIAYSEGTEAENYLRTVFRESGSLSSQSEELEGKIRDWSSEYHLTATRANILRCLNLDSIGNALELGCGCGALTRYLGEQNIHVDAVEGGAARAEIARLRCRDLDSVEIVQANFNSLNLPDNSYDAVFLMGVLEYAAMFMPGEANDLTAINKIFDRLRKSLRPDGVLIVAIENRFGLKYWFGAKEDHLAKPYLGLYGYPDRGGVRTYSRGEFTDILSNSGWKYSSFLYPFPDYKLPRVILSDSYLEQDSCAHSLLYRLSSRDYLSDWTVPANEFLIWKGLHQSGNIADFANSFLLLASNAAEKISSVSPYDFVHFSDVGRRQGFRTVTSKKKGEKEVVKTSLNPGSDQGMVPISQVTESSPYYSGELLTTLWIESFLKANPLDLFSHLLKDYCRFTDEYEKSLDDINSNLDLLPSNIIVDDQSQYHVIDQEWQAETNVPGAFLLFRSLLWFAIHNKEILESFCEQYMLSSVDAFLSFWFEQTGFEYNSKKQEYINREEAIHGSIVFQDDNGLDVEVLLAISLGVEKSVRVEVLPEFENDRREELEARMLDLEKEKKHRIIKTSFKRSVLAVAGIEAKRILKVMKNFLFNKHYRVLRRSRLFDSAFYRANDAQLQDQGLDPLQHYVQFGYAEGRDPNLFFSKVFYSEQVPGIKESGEDPLLHYIRSGWQEGRNPCPLFDTRYYQSLYPDISDRKNPLEHFLTKGWQGGRRSNLYFDPDYYLRNNHDVAEAGGLALLHYLLDGMAELRQPSLFFDSSWYIDRVPSLRGYGPDPIAHYIRYGCLEGKSPNPLFDPKYYRRENGDATQQRDPFAHYITKGMELDRRPSEWFDPVYYRQHYLANKTSKLSPLEHYLESGLSAGFYPDRRIDDLDNKPVISIVVPVYNVDESYLNNCVRSVLYQAYPHWELCLVDDCSTQENLRGVLEGWAARDHRIKVGFLDENMGISGATNAAARLATGDYLAFLDNDDELSCDCLYQMVKAICDTGADLLYSDEDLIGDDSSQLSVFRKPDFNRELLMCHNYVTHFVVAEKSLFDKVGGFDRTMDGAQDFDLFLKLSERADRIVHIPEILYHWRASESSTSVNHNQKTYANEAGRKAVENAMRRRGEEGKAECTEWKFYYKSSTKLSSFPSVSIIVPYKDESFEAWLTDLVTRTIYPDIEYIVILDSGVSYTALEQRICAISPTISVITVASECNRGASYNQAVESCGGQYLIFFNSWVKVKGERWIEGMLKYGMESGIGMVGGRIRPVNAQEFITTIPLLNRQDDLYYNRFFQECSRHLNGLHCSQNVMAVSWNLAMTNRDLFVRYGGFDESELANVFADTDLCLRLVANGFENIYTPFVEGEWLVSEEALADSNKSPWQKERAFFQERWSGVLELGDPFYNCSVLSRDGMKLDDFLKWYRGQDYV